MKKAEEDAANARKKVQRRSKSATENARKKALAVQTKRQGAEKKMEGVLRTLSAI